MRNNEFLKRLMSSLILLPLSFFVINKGSTIFLLFLISCFIISIFEWSKFKIRYRFLIPGYFFLFCSFISIYLLRENDPIEGLFFVTFITVICISSDIGGYIFGRIFKGPKITTISPNKTYSGVVGAYIVTFTSTFYLILFFKNIDFYFQNVLLIFLISTISQVGDLIISYFKRESKIKDTGSIIPGHGGLLDRIDGMIFAFPLTFLILSF